MPRTSKKAAPAVKPEIAPAPEAKAPKAAAPKASAPKAAASKASAVEEQIILQFAGSEWNMAELREKAISEFVAEGHARGRIKKLTLYVKPEEHRAYYVINDKVAGGVDFD